MRYVQLRNTSFIPLTLALSGCLSNGSLNWTPVPSSYHLAFLNYTSATTISISSSGGSSVPDAQVAIQNNLSQTVTNVGSYAVSLSLYSDPTCTTPVTFTGAASNSVSASTATQNGVATLSLDGGGGNPSSGVAYYLKATADGLTSGCSSSLTFSMPQPLNLVVPIEMLDLGANAVMATINQIFLRSQTSLDTGNYDGTVSYSFEIVAENLGTTGTSSVVLENNSSTIFATIPIPLSTGVTRYRTAFTPTLGSDTYRVKLSAATTGGDLHVFAARMIVQQVGATKTKLYIPLLNGPYNSASTDTTQTIGGINTTYTSGQAPINQTIWAKSNSAYATLSSTNPWTLEVVSSAMGGDTVSAGLYDMDSPGLVSSSEMSTTNTTPSLQTISFSDSALISGHRYVLASKSSTATGHAIYRAGLWVTLTDLSAAEIYHRFNASQGAINGALQTQHQRIIVDASQYSNPSFYVETTGSDGAGVATVGLADCGVNDTGTGCLVMGSPATVASTTARSRSSNSLSITNGNRYIFSAAASGVTLQETASFLVVTIHR